MTPLPPVWGVEAGDRAITAVRVRRTADNGLEVLSWWSVPVPPGSDPVAFLATTLRKKGLRDHALQVALPGRGATCRAYRIAPEDADVPPQELERELLEFVPFEPPEIHLRSRRLGGPGVLDYRVVTEKRAELARWEKGLEEAGFRWFGLSLAPAALLTAMESLRLGPPRGYALRLQGSWAVLFATDGPLTARYPLPFGLHDVDRALAAAGVDPAEARDAQPGSPASERSWQALLQATRPLGEDLRRLVEFHRSAVHGTGEETLLVTGPGTDRPGIRAALAHWSPVPLMPLRKWEDLAPLRPGARIPRDEFLDALPSLTVALGAALSGAGLAPRDLDFRHLPEVLPHPAERSLLPVAASLLVAGVAASWWLAVDTRQALARGKEACLAIPGPPPAAGPGPEATAVLARETLAAAGSARSRNALARGMRELLALQPEPGEAPAFTTEGFGIQHIPSGYRVDVRVLPQGVPARDAAEERLRIRPLLQRLADSGWQIFEVEPGRVTLRRTFAAEDA